MEIKLFKKEKSFKKKNTVPNPAAYWVPLVVLLLAAFVFSLAYGYYSFSNTKKDYNQSAVDDNITVKNRTEKLQRALEYFSAREKKSREIINSPAVVVDPSM